MTIQERLKKNEDAINSANRINGNLLRIIQDAANPHSMSKNPTTTSRADDISKTYKPSEVGSAIANGFEQCNKIRNQLIELQNVIKEMAQNANR